MGEFDFVKSTVTHVASFTVCADPAKFEEQEKIDESWKNAVKRRNEEYLKRAGSRPIVRKSYSNGPCIFQGILIRETPKFYVFAVNAHARDGLLESFPQQKLSKDNAHIEPCKRCTDHPQTDYPMGFLD
jgi:hypothetical protein